MNEIYTNYICECGGRVVLLVTPYHQDCRAECKSCGRHTSWSYTAEDAEKEWVDRFGARKVR